ncbi:hypothetical protein FBZ93_12215 [Bradyrhizobium macuxiense]|uniref:Uncharacterized protein n=1 Tax=Bradyrhizobium macuxiense TaxID=1755647 RepID=A0A560KYT7_9BRAD|nr:hypothetical protein [Bradyrhizobium macuxiense]TWB87234.1 hypothetical protein FBZ93_12215 [Bradyrhizobium macuxiense]
MEFAEAPSPFLFVYMLGFLCATGHFYRDRKVPMGPKQVVASVAWPIWWPIANGFGGLVDAIDTAVTATDGRKSASFGLGLAVGH